MAIDVAHQRLFAGCHNQLMAVGGLSSTVKSGREPSPLARDDREPFDPGTGLALASMRVTGSLTVAAIEDPPPTTTTVVRTIADPDGGLAPWALKPKIKCLSQ